MIFAFKVLSFRVTPRPDGRSRQWSPSIGAGTTGKRHTHGRMETPCNKKGSSRFPGEGSLDFQEEVLRVAEAVGHALDHLDAVVHALENAGVHVELRTGQDASSVSAQVAGEAL